MKPIVLDFRYENRNPHDTYAHNFISRGAPVPAMIYVVVVAADFSVSDDGVTQATILPQIFATEAEARAVAKALPSATGVLGLESRVHSFKLAFDSIEEAPVF
jgi:hypothetical protein